MTSGGELEISLLGEVTLRRDGQVLTLPPSRKTRALLVYLILNPGRHRREKLCELLWQLPDDPRGSLRWSLSKLRALVNEEGIERIQADRGYVQFNLSAVTVDLLELRTQLAGGCAGLDTGELSGIAERLSRETLADLDLSGQPEFDIFLGAEREQIRKLRSTVLRALLARHCEGSGDVLGWLQQLVTIEPYDVELHLQLIGGLALAGRRKDAMRQYEQSIAVLGDIGDQTQRTLQLAAQRKPGARDEATSQVTAVPPRQEIRFCRAGDGVQIAYALVGKGPPLVKTANWLNHLEYDWESPVWRHVFRGLAHGRELIRYDARGNGLSDWNVPDFSIDSLVADLEAVVEASAVEKFPLLGISQGCAISVEYAARHPEKVSRLILIGGYARGWGLADSGEFVEQNEAMLSLVRTGWGRNSPAFRQLFTSIFMPDAPAENQTWFNELQRITTRPENAARLFMALRDIDVRHRLTEVKAPTLVVHARHDLAVPFSAGRELAGGISGARFVSLDSANHLPPECDPAWTRLETEINAFLAQ